MHEAVDELYLAFKSLENEIGTRHALQERTFPSVIRQITYQALRPRSVEFSLGLGLNTTVTITASSSIELFADVDGVKIDSIGSGIVLQTTTDRKLSVGKLLFLGSPSGMLTFELSATNPAGVPPLLYPGSSIRYY